MNRTFKSLLVGALALAIAVPPITTKLHTYKAVASSYFIQESPDYTYAYLLGAGYYDAYPMGVLDDGKTWYYGVKDPKTATATLVGPSKALSTYENRSSWNISNVDIDRFIPNKFGKYSTVGIVSIDTLNMLNLRSSDFKFPTVINPTMSNLEESITSDISPKLGIFDSNPAIVYKNETPSTVDGVTTYTPYANWSGIQEEQKYIYASTGNTIDSSKISVTNPTDKEQYFKLSFNLKTNWLVATTDGNAKKDLWSTDAKSIILKTDTASNQHLIPPFCMPKIYA